jgi:hypothetical protein
MSAVQEDLEGGLNVRPRVPRARSLLLAGVLGAVIVLMAFAGAAAFFFLQHHHSEPASARAAEAEFQDLRARFAGQSPLLDPGAGQPLGSMSAPSGTAPLQSFHTVIFDTRGSRRIVRITVPYWFGRRFARHGGGFRWLGELTFLDDTEFDPVPIHLSLEEIERHGPGLIADYRHASGGQFIAWVE